MSSPAASPPGHAGSPWDLLSQGWLRTPLTSLLLYCLVSVFLQENYPFSHFPMYSNPSRERPYYMVSDGDGNPIPIDTLTGVTCPKIGKIYRKECEELAKKLKLNKDRLPAEHKQAIGEKMFSYLRTEAEAHQKTLPPKLLLVRMEISYRNGKLSESSAIIAKE